MALASRRRGRLNLEPALELYHGLPSTCSKKVRLVLYEKALPFRSHLMDLRKFEQHDPDYLKLNPNGVVPTLVHDGRAIVESSVIMEYLEDAFPEPSRRPADPFGRARVRLWLKFSDDAAYPAVYAPTWTILNRDAMRGLSAPEREALLARIPTAERRKRWEDISTNGFPREVMDAAVQKMRLCLARCEEALTITPWLAGQDYSLADMAVAPFVDRIRNLHPEFLAMSDYSRVSDWYARLRERPAFVKAIDFKDDPRAAEMINM
jgi:ganglioside-induced differentiation-associated protein 1